MLSAATARRFWSKVSLDTPDSCWLWQGWRNRDGYGHYSHCEGGSKLAHVIAYRLQVGPVPKGKQLDHVCRNRACCNPTHLEPVTARENVLRGIGFAARHAQATHCLHGHEFTPENTRFANLADRKYPRRSCRTCDRLSQQRRRAQFAGKVG